MNIKQQIRQLPIPESLQTRILELVIFAKSYDLENCHTEFMLTQAFDWTSTREGVDFWLNVHVELEQYKFEKQGRKNG